MDLYIRYVSLDGISQDPSGSILLKSYKANSVLDFVEFYTIIHFK